MAMNYASKFSKKAVERFTKQSVTDEFAGKDYEFEGVKTVKVMTVDTVPINDYQRSGTNRYGTPQELGDTVQELTMTQDKAFTFTVDKGNDMEQLNLKNASVRLRTIWDESIIPMVDKYRLATYASGAGMVTIGTKLTKNTIVEAMMTGLADMNDALVPEANRVIYISESAYVSFGLSDQIMGLDALGAKYITKGTVGSINGSTVIKKVPTSYLPSGVPFVIKYKNSSVDPVKLEDMKIHKDPPGINGDLAEGRMLHDSFVIGTKANGIFVYAETGTAAVNPVIAVASGSATITSTTTGATIKYTLDGTDPKTSGTAATYSAAVTVGSDVSVIKAYASKSDLLNSGVTSFEL